MAGIVNVDVGGILGGVFGLIDDLVTSDEEREQLKLKLLTLQTQGELAQLEVNKTEAQHSTIFVAGWRPFIGWVCGTAFAYHFVLYPLLQFAAWLLLVFTGNVFPADSLPRLDLAEMIPVLMGMLGLSGLRTIEKRSGVSTGMPPAQPRRGRLDEGTQLY